MSIKNQLISGRVPVTTAANVAASRYQYLDLSSAEPNLGTSSNNGDVLIYDSTVTGGRRWIPQSDIVGSIGIFAYGAANTAAANTVYLSGVDITQNNKIFALETVNTEQNTNITSVNTYATSAFGKANSANVLAQAAFDKANSANILAQAAFDKANTAITTSGGSITGSLNVSQNLAVTGNLTVLGTSTTINTSSFVVSDSLIQLGVGNYTSDLLDIGVVGHYNDGTNAHTGFIRDVGTKEWYVFKGYTQEVVANNNININHASFAKANLNADYFKGNVAFPDGTVQATAINLRMTGSPTAPANPTVGDLWYDTDYDVLMRYTYDGTSNNWIDITGPI